MKRTQTYRFKNKDLITKELKASFIKERTAEMNEAFKHRLVTVFDPDEKHQRCSDVKITTQRRFVLDQSTKVGIKLEKDIDPKKDLGMTVGDLVALPRKSNSIFRVTKVHVVNPDDVVVTAHVRKSYDRLGVVVFDLVAGFKNTKDTSVKYPIEDNCRCYEPRGFIEIEPIFCFDHIIPRNVRAQLKTKPDYLGRKRKIDLTIALENLCRVDLVDMGIFFMKFQQLITSAASEQ